MYPQDEELHAELMAAFRVYFEANQRWLAEGTKRACMDTRAAMSEIRRICSARRKDLMKWREWKDLAWAERKRERLAQKAQKAKVDPDN